MINRVNNMKIIKLSNCSLYVDNKIDKLEKDFDILFSQLFE